MDKWTGTVANAMEDRLSREYGAAGLLGMLAPQANTTVEPEFWALLPPGWSMLTARLTSPRDGVSARLAHYAERFVETAADFANAPLDVVAVGCTGTSYLTGLEREAASLAALAAERGVPALSAATAATAALRALGARRVALLSPYPEDLTQAAMAYWRASGFEPTAVDGPRLESTAFHPIYAMRGGSILAALERLAAGGPDAVLMLGTGMATLGPLLASQGRGWPPAISCNVALAWAATRAADGAALDATSLAPWLTGAAWRRRATAIFPALAPAS